MLKLVSLASLALSFASAHAEPTVISRVKIEYQRVVYGANNDRMAAIGGKVDYTGPGPVFTTLSIGGQNYSAPTDPSGNYSYFIWVNDNQYNVSAWTTPSDAKADVPVTPSVSKSATLPETPKH